MITIIIFGIIGIIIGAICFYDDRIWILSIVGGVMGGGIGLACGAMVGLIIPGKFEEQIISFPLGNDTGSQTTFLETETIEGEEYYVFYYYGKNGCLKQEKFLKKKALIESSHNIDMAKIEIRRYSCDENATINYFSLRKIPDPEVIIYLPSYPID